MTLLPLIRLSVVLAVLPAVACSQEAPPVSRPSRSAQDPEPGSEATKTPSEFARFVKVGDDEGRFEVAITTYEGSKGERVSLIAAVHIADAVHYRDLQKEFEKYDVLLYELVAEPDQRPTPEQKRATGIVGALQVALKNGLDLEFQLHAIDYTPDNFIHADLTPDAFAQKMEERGESFVTILWRLMSAEMKRQQELAEEQADREEAGEDTSEPAYDLVSAFRNREGRHMLRLMFAQQLEQMEALAAGAGPGQETVLLEGRNERAVEVMREQVAEGHKEIGIYYGGAHMPGIEKTLVDELGYRKVGQRWLVAWDITKRLDDARPKKKQ